MHHPYGSKILSPRDLCYIPGLRGYLRFLPKSLEARLSGQIYLGGPILNPPSLCVHLCPGNRSTKLINNNLFVDCRLRSNKVLLRRNYCLLYTKIPVSISESTIKISVYRSRHFQILTFIAQPHKLHFQSRWKAYRSFVLYLPNVIAGSLYVQVRKTTNRSNKKTKQKFRKINNECFWCSENK